MSDIADKIYAVTGLTLGAEAAAVVGQMIQVENEKMQATLNFAVTAHHKAINTVISLVAERDTLREATKMALECLEDCDVIGAKQTLAKALGEKG